MLLLSSPMATLVCCKRVAAWAGWSNITSNKKNLPVCHNVHIFSSPTLLLSHSISSMLFAACGFDWPLAWSIPMLATSANIKLPSINSDFNVPHMVPVSSSIKYCTPSLSFRHVTPMHYHRWYQKAWMSCSLLLATTSNKCNEGSDTKATRATLENNS